MNQETYDKILAAVRSRGGAIRFTYGISTTLGGNVEWSECQCALGCYARESGMPLHNGSFLDQLESTGLAGYEDLLGFARGFDYGGIETLDTRVGLIRAYSGNPFFLAGRRMAAELEAEGLLK